MSPRPLDHDPPAVVQTQDDPVPPRPAGETAALGSAAWRTAPAAQGGRDSSATDRSVSRGIVMDLCAATTSAPSRSTGAGDGPADAPSSLASQCSTAGPPIASARPRPSWSWQGTETASGPPSCAWQKTIVCAAPASDNYYPGSGKPRGLGKKAWRVGAPADMSDPIRSLFTMAGDRQSVAVAEPSIRMVAVAASNDHRRRHHVNHFYPRRRPA